MKKLFLGFVVALIAMTFSAFTTKQESKLVDIFYYLAADGKYYEITGYYDHARCGASSSGSCIYRWYTGGDSGLPSPLTATEFNTFLNAGYFIAGGVPNRRYIP